MKLSNRPYHTSCIHMVFQYACEHGMAFWTRGDRLNGTEQSRRISSLLDLRYVDERDVDERDENELWWITQDELHRLRELK